MTSKQIGDPDAYKLKKRLGEDSEEELDEIAETDALAAGSIKSKLRKSKPKRYLTQMAMEKFLTENLTVRLRMRPEYGLGDNQKLIEVQLVLKGKIISEDDVTVDNQ